MPPATSSHVVLLGDSIFDNAAYVPGQPPVAEQLSALVAPWQVTLLAVDGHRTADVPRQLTRLPQDATHAVVSVGGNDALPASSLFAGRYPTPAELMTALAQAQADFAADYAEMLAQVTSSGLPVVVCTVYDSVPGRPRWELAGLALFNDVIFRQAARAAVPVIDLRLVCDQPEDYSPLSPIEPSAAGGAKIAAQIARVVREHDFAQRRAVIYS